MIETETHSFLVDTLLVVRNSWISALIAQPQESYGLWKS
ncbi:MAG: hypothetical protein RLZZ92_668 [Actinomycetota bacterium]|jgi:hypothetical protein